jgi:chemotaxis protein MotA
MPVLRSLRQATYEEKDMDITGIMGFVLAIFLMIFGIVFNVDAGIVFANMVNFIDYPSIAITVGGTLAVLMISFPTSIFLKIPKHLKIIFMPQSFDQHAYIKMITEFAKEARIRGLLSLEGKLADVKDEFLKKSLLLVVDSIDADKVNSILETELDHIDERHHSDIEFYQKGAAFAPAFGMIGTLIGLVNMLKQMSDPDAIGPAMAVALLTTLYGSLLANIFFLPIANKLKIRHDEEMLCKMIVAQGVKSIQAGENPRFIEEKLLLMIESKKRSPRGSVEKTDKKAKALNTKKADA